MPWALTVLTKAESVDLAQIAALKPGVFVVTRMSREERNQLFDSSLMKLKPEALMKRWRSISRSCIFFTHIKMSSTY